MANPHASSDPLETALQLMHAQRFDDAVTLLTKVVQKNRSHDQAYFYLAAAEAQVAQLGPARNHLREAIKLSPRQAEYHQELGVVCQLLGRYDESHAAFDEALKLAPRNPASLASKASVYRLQGRYDDAVALLEPWVDDPPADRRFAIVFGSLAHRMGREQQAIDLLESIESELAEGDRSKASIAFQLGAVRDRVGDYDAAFADFTRANKLYGVQFDPESFSARVDEFIECWSIDRFLELPRAKSTRASQKELAVFIVGMPRSGTSLAEQIIASHPEAHGAGELDNLNGLVQEVEGAPYGFVPLMSLNALTPQRVEKMSRTYLSAISKLERRAKRITDKMPQNFIHLGAIALLFPDARILHTRRDPLDTCLSCFFQDFSTRLTFTFDLEHCGHYYRQYERLMSHWATLFDAAREAGIPTPEVTEVVYEDLTSDQEVQTRRLIDAVGLEWNDQCLRFHETERLTRTASTEQVRQPMYRTSVARHKHYEKHLDGLRAALRGSGFRGSG